MTRYIRALYDSQKNRWLQGKLGLPLGPVPLCPGDLCHLQVIYLNSTDNLAAYTIPLFMVKTWDNWLNGGNFAFAANTYDDGDPFHNPSLNQVSIPFITPYSLPRTDYPSSLALFTAAGQKMETQILPMCANMAMYQGTETNIPVGTPGANSFTVTVPSGATSSPPQVVAGLTAATGKVLAQLETSTGGFSPWIVTVADGSFVVNVPTAPDTLIPGATFIFSTWVLHL